MLVLARRYGSLFRQSWKPDYQGRPTPVSLQRVGVMALFWPLFVLVQAINGAGMALDYVLFPSFRRLAVREPLFVVGIPRSGTTFLHRLLAQDQQRFTTTALWELLFAPSITQRYFWSGLAKLDRRLGAPCGRLLGWAERRLLGGLESVHKTGLRDPEEDYLALLPVLGCFLLVLAVPSAPMWRLAYLDVSADDAEKQRLMRAYLRFVQRHLYFHGVEKTLLSKNPSFTPWIRALAQTFPDAHFIGCVRNPGAAVASQISSIQIGARLFDGRDRSDYWRDSFMDMLDFYYRHLLETLPQMPESRWGLSVMERLAVAPKKTVCDFYRRFGWTPDATYLAQLDEQEHKARQYRSRHQYSLEGVGLSEAQVYARFRWVYERFAFPLHRREA